MATSRRKKSDSQGARPPSEYEKEEEARIGRYVRNRIASAIFAAAQSVGISDRQLAEQLTDLAIWRLEQQQKNSIIPLPGMEHLTPRPAKGEVRPPMVAELRRVIGEVLSQSGHPEIAQAYLGHRPSPPRESPPRNGDRQAEKEKKIKEDKPLAKGEPTLKLPSNTQTVLERRYLRKDSQGRPIETAEEMFRRVAQNIAAADLKYSPKANVKAREEEFYQVMVNFELLPNSPTLMNAGRDLQQLSACFVLPVDDSIESIFETIKHTALIHKSGGVTGFSFSRIRPENDRVKTTGGVASGPVSFIRVFDAATDAIKQGGTRRGANMAILSIDHPDIEKFIRAKEDERALNNFNISVAVTDKFMEAVEKGEDYDLINPRTKEITGRLNAKKVFDQIVEMAWRNGDPGLIFLDKINQANPTPQLGPIESTNPCGEQPLLPYESCNLGSINLAKMVRLKDGKPSIDHAKLERVIRTAVRFLDNVIDMNNFPLPKIGEMTYMTRKIGLGVMGFADMLIQLSIPYDSDEALKTGEELMRFISEKARETSAELAAERSVFPAFEGSIHDVTGGPRVRNATCTTIAPTGTLSIISNCSSGIEPLFALSYVRNILDNDKLVEINPLFEEIAKREGFYDPELMEKLAEKGSIQDMEGIPPWVKRLFVTAHDISPEWHVRMQAAFQKYTDNAVSKTVNFPHNATKEDVAKVYMMAYKMGCKGITIYRDASRGRQVLATRRKKEERIEEARIQPRTRPTTTLGRTEKVSTGCGNLYITVNSDDEGMCEVFSHLGKSGGCASAQAEATSRLISLALRSGVDPGSIVEQLRGIRCPSIVWDNGRAILSCPDAIGTVLQDQLKGVTAVAEKKEDYEPVRNLAGQCPDCSSLLVYQEGCLICRNCGYTKCA